MEKERLLHLISLKYSIRKIADIEKISPSTVRRYLNKYSLKTLPTKNSKKNWTDEQLIIAVKESTATIEVIRKLGLSESAGNYQTVNNHIERLNLDTSHFLGKSWLRDTERVHPRSFPLDEILVANSSYVSSNNLRKRLLKEGIKEYKCENCGLFEWRGKKLPLELEHINGNHKDNRLDNLLLLCPNCHSLTPTWRRKHNAPLPQLVEGHG